LGRVKFADGKLLGLAGGADVLGLRVGMVDWFHAYSQSTTGDAEFALQLLCIEVVR
jgi:hypothetical protein